MNFIYVKNDIIKKKIELSNNKLYLLEYGIWNY